MKTLHKHKTTGKLYLLVQDHLLCKNYVKSERVYTPDSFEMEFNDVYEWDTQNADKTVLVKALYENHDGPYFVMNKDTFEKEFESASWGEDVTLEAVESLYVSNDAAEDAYTVAFDCLISRILDKKMWREFFEKNMRDDSYLPETAEDNFRYYQFSCGFSFMYDYEDGKCTQTKKFVKFMWHNEYDESLCGSTYDIPLSEVDEFLAGPDDYAPLVEWKANKDDIEKLKQMQKDYALYLKLKKQFEE